MFKDQAFQEYAVRRQRLSTENIEHLFSEQQTKVKLPVVQKTDKNGKVSEVVLNFAEEIYEDIGKLQKKIENERYIKGKFMNSMKLMVDENRSSSKRLSVNFSNPVKPIEQSLADNTLSLSKHSAILEDDTSIYGSQGVSITKR